MSRNPFPIAVSTLIKEKAKNGSVSEAKKRTREEWIKDKEVEEARKLGKIPAAVDERGKDINPHIPQYISSTPWYYGATAPTLKHQRIQNEDETSGASRPDLNKWYNRGTDTRIEQPSGGARLPSRYRRGACENCGAMTHTRKQCLERPRKLSLKHAKIGTFTVSADDTTQPDLQLDYDGKRDRWNGYDTAEYTRDVVTEYRRVEQAKRELKAERLSAATSAQEAVAADVDAERSGDEEGGRAAGVVDEEEGDKYAESVDMPGTKVDSKQRITVRNLRIREDTAKYLRNLDLDSAYYDPKTRSMRDNPYAHTHTPAGGCDELYGGENSVRYTGDTVEQARSQLFAWEVQRQGVQVHSNSDPTRLELMRREYETRRADLKQEAHQSLFERYGGSQHLSADRNQLLDAQTETYVEYSRTGAVIGGNDVSAGGMRSSRYAEDVLENNHTAVWGSFWCDGQWGYKCCLSVVRNSYCTAAK